MSWPEFKYFYIYIQNRKIEIHPDDLNLEKEPKNFFEALASMEAYTEEDRELSEGSDDEG